MPSLRVARAEKLAEGIYLFELRDPTGADLPAFTPGSHIEVKTPSGALRKYSLSNDPFETDRYVIAVKREENGRGGSASMCDSLKEGDLIEASGPKNDFPMGVSPAGYTLIAGGIGITPILCMARQLMAESKPFKLYYLTRSPELTAFLEELKGPEFRGKVIIHHDGGDPDKAIDLWPILEKPKGQIYCCGPAPLMDAVRDMSGHWSQAAVHFEAFTDGHTIKPDDVPFTVKLAKSGKSYAVPVGTPILEVLRNNGHDVPFSCEAGSCGSCRTGLISGDVDHRDFVLMEEEKDTNIMVCVSRGRGGEITIDM